MNKKRFLKSILATSALAAAIAPGAAFANARTSTAAGALNTATAGANGFSAAVTDNTDSVQINHDGVNMTITNGNSPVGIDLNSKSGTTIATTNNAEMGAIGGSGDQTATLSVGAGHTFTINSKAAVVGNAGAPAAADMTGLGAVTLGAGSTLNITPAAAADHVFGAATTIDGDGTLAVDNAGKNTTFNGVIGGTTGLTALDIAANSRVIATQNITSKTTTLADNAGTKLTFGGAGANDAVVTHTGDITVNDNGTVATVNKAAIVGDVTLTKANGVFAVGANSNTTLTGDIKGNAGSNTTIGASGSLTIDTTAADRSAAGLINGSANHDEGELIITGGNKFATGAALGGTKRLAHIKTGDGLTTLGAAATTKKLTIGTGGISTATGITVGADGVQEGTGDLTFTATGQTLSVAGNYANTGKIHLNKTGAAALTYTAAHAAAAGNSVVDASFTTENDAADTLNFAAANQANQITINKDIGAADKQWKFVNLNGAGTVPEVILNGKKVYVSDSLDVAATAHGNKLTFKGDAEIVGGKLKATNANGIIQLGGKNSKAKAPLVANANSKFAFFNVLADAEKSTLEIGADDTDRALTLDAASFANTGANDTSGLVINLSGIATKGNTYSLNLGTTKVTTDGAHGGIKFTGSKFAADDAIQVTLTDDVGTDKTRHIASFDATGHKVHLKGGKALHTRDFKASEVELSANTTLGIYNTETAGQVAKIVSNTAGNSGTIAANSKLKDGTNIHFGAAANHTSEIHLKSNVALKGTLTSEIVGNAGLLIIDAGGGQNVNFTSAGTQNNAITQIKFKGAGNDVATLNFGSSAYVNDLNIDGTGTLNFKGNLKGKITRQDAAATGTLVLQGGSVEGSIGAAGLNAALNKVVVDTAENFVVASDANAAREFHATEVHFKKNGAIELHKNATAGNSRIGTVTTDNKNEGRFIFNQDMTTNGNIGDVNRPIQSITMNENKTFNVGAGKALHVTNLVTGVNNEGTVAFGGASVATTTSIGSADKRFANVTLTGNVDLTDVYSTKLNLNANGLTARHVNVSDVVGIQGAGNLTIRDGGSVTGKTAGGVITQGSAVLNSDIGGVLTTTASANGKVIELNASKVTGVATFGNSTLNLGNTVAFQNNVVAKTSVINLGSNQMRLDAGKSLTFTGNQTLTVDGSVTPIVADTVTLTNANDVITINLLDITAVDFKLAQSNTGAIAGGTKFKASNFQFGGNDFIQGVATYDAATGVVGSVNKLKVEDVAKPAQLAKDHTKDFMTQLVKNLPTISGSDTLRAWGREYNTYTDGQKITLVDQLASNDQAAATVPNANARGAAQEAIGARFNEVGFAAADSAQGVAAGDAADKFGLWAKGTFGTATQKLRKGESGYKSNSYGAFVGVDTMLNDKATAGLLVGYSNDRMKLKDTKSGGKTKANSWMFGAYGSYDLPQNFFVQGNAAVAQTSVKTREARLAATATGSYDVIGYTAEVRGGYKLRFDNSLIVPTAGLRLNYLGDTSYTEKGAGLNNKKVAGKARTGIDAVAGVTLATALDVDGMVLNPEVHMNVDYALSNQAAKVDYNLDGSNVKFNYKGAKPAKFGYNFGASVMTQADNIEYGVGYDARISDKYLGHTGSVKVKVNF